MSVDVSDVYPTGTPDSAALYVTLLPSIAFGRGLHVQRQSSASETVLPDSGRPVTVHTDPASLPQRLSLPSAQTKRSPDGFRPDHRRRPRLYSGKSLLYAGVICNRHLIPGNILLIIANRLIICEGGEILCRITGFHRCIGNWLPPGAVLRKRQNFCSIPRSFLQ